jgi:NDP-sugar pyrophosphorylase family protein
MAGTSLSVAELAVAVLAGGLATRLRELTQTVPKSLVRVGGRPFIDHQLEMLYSKGVRRVVLCLGHLGEQIQSHVGDGAAYGMKVEYSFDGPTRLGTAGALRQALPLLTDPFGVIYGDSYLDFDLHAVLSHFHHSGADALLTVYHDEGAHDTANALFAEGKLVCYDKRSPTPQMRHIDYGFALLRPAAVAAAVAEGQAADLADLYHDLVAAGRMTGYEVHDRFYEIGSLSGLREADEFLGRRPG